MKYHIYHGFTDMRSYLAAGFRRLGFGRIISTLAVPFIHGSFSYPTSPSILPDPFMR
jgi:hypothetical protein